MPASKQLYGIKVLVEVTALPAPVDHRQGGQVDQPQFVFDLQGPLW